MPVSQLPSPAAVSALDMSGGTAVLGYDLTDQEYRTAFAQNFTQRGFRLADIWGYESNSQPRYAAIWEQCRQHPAQWTRHEIPAVDFQAEFNARKAAGFRPVRICGYTAGSVTRYAAVFERVGGPLWGARHNFNMLGLSNHLREVRRDGFRVVDIDAYSSFEISPDMPGSTTPTFVSRFSSIWVQNDGREWTVSLPVDFDAYQALHDRMHDEGWLPKQVSVFGSPPRVVARWEKDSILTAARHGRDSATFATDLTAQDGAGLRPASIGGYSDGRGTAARPRFAPIWQRRDADQVVPGLVDAFLRTYEIPGLSLAVSRRGRLVYARGFGLADTVTGQRVTTASRFRIASLAKPITATTVMRLADRGDLALDDTVFGSEGILASFGTPHDPRATQITVRHLLQHSAGAWPNDANDPMMSNPGLSAVDLIFAVLALHTLNNAPGTAFAYSNFGYCILGRVIAKVTGQAYDAHVRQHVLAPCGITGMELAGNTLADRRPDEVRYQGLDGDDPYALPVRRMDAHGGWLGTAIDVLRFLVRVDGFATVPDILPASAITTMTTPSGLPGSDGYAAGWSTNTEGSRWHDGFLPGSTATLVRTSDELCWVALANGGRRDASDPTRDAVVGLDSLLWAIRDKVDFWPLSNPL